jgi:hypothetical protein
MVVIKKIFLETAVQLKPGIVLDGVVEKSAGKFELVNPFGEKISSNSDDYAIEVFPGKYYTVPGVEFNKIFQIVAP